MASLLLFIFRHLSRNILKKVVEESSSSVIWYCYDDETISLADPGFPREGLQTSQEGVLCSLIHHLKSEKIFKKSEIYSLDCLHHLEYIQISIKMRKIVIQKSKI